MYDIVLTAVTTSTKQGIIRDDLEKTVMDFVTSDSFVRTITNNILNNGSLMNSIANYVKDQTTKTMDNLDINEVVERTLAIQDRVMDYYNQPGDGENSLDVKPRREKKSKVAKTQDTSSSSSSESDKEPEKTKSKVDEDGNEIVDLTEDNKYTDTVPVIIPVNNLFTKALDYSTYRLQNTSDAYNVKMIHKYQKRISQTLKTVMFDSSDAISILSFLEQFKRTCDSCSVNEGSAMWIIPHFMKKPAGTALMNRVRFPDKVLGNETEGILQSHPAVINHLLSEYASDQIIAEAVAELNDTKQKEQ